MESLSRVSAMMDPARELTSEAAQAVGISKGLKSSSSTKSIPFAKLKALLDSRSDRDILDGLRRVVAMIYQGKPCLPYFSSVVKNVANPNIEVKKLVYVYLLHYAESDPDLALLSVNAIQKSLTDQNPQVRAMALRTMSGLRVPVISQIVSLAIKRGVGDMSPYVRRAAALAIPKCYSLDPNTLPQLLDYVCTLIGDKQYFVVGPAVSAFLEICPDRIDLIHKHYRSLVKKLVDMDEWGQLATIRLLTYYSRRCFPYRTQKVTKATAIGFYDEPTDELETETGTEIRMLDPDLDLFLKACHHLLHSRNSAVILAVVSAFYYLGSDEHLQSAIGPLIALLRTPPDIAQTALCNIVSIALTHATLFVSYASHFLIHSTDPPQIWSLKLELLTLIFSHSPRHQQNIILSDLAHFAHYPSNSDQNLVQSCIQSIGRCAQTSHSSTQSRIFTILLSLLTSPSTSLVSEVLTVLRHLIQQDPTSHTKTIIRLARNLDRTSSPDARASIIWLVGEFAAGNTGMGIAPDVLRILLRGFADEAEAVKGQIVLLAAKVYLHYLLQHPSSSGQEGQHVIEKLWSYTLQLVRYDTSYDLRDRARMFKNLLPLSSSSPNNSTELASLLLLAPKPVPLTPSPSQSRKDLLLGSSALVLGTKDVEDYEGLPEWVKLGEEPDSKLRDGDGVEEAKAGSVSASKRLDEMVRSQGMGKGVAIGADRGKGKEIGKGKTLDDWLDESESEAEDEDGSEDDSEEGGEEETEEEEESGEEEEESEDDENGNDAARKRLVS